MIGIYSNKKTCLLKRLGLAIVTTLIITFGGVAIAAEVIEEVVVTAQKRAQNIQDVPLSISAETGEELRDQGVSSILDLSIAVPFVNVSRNIGVPNIYIRGIGSSFLGVGGDGSISLHLDGVYMSRPRAQIAGFYDVNRIEVLRGPQGTLYGRNATGGNINVITNKPTDEPSGYAVISAGNYGRLDLEAAVGGPLGENSNGRLSILRIERNGYGQNIHLGTDIDDQSEQGIRGQLDFMPTERLSVLLSVDRYEADDAAFGWHISGQATARPLTAVALGATGLPSNLRDIDSLVPTAREIDITGGSLTLSYDLRDDLQFKSITGQRDSLSSVQTDVSSGIPPSVLIAKPLVPISQHEESEWFSQEFQLVWTRDKLNALFGLYYFDEDLFGNVHIPTNALTLLGASGLGMIPVPFPSDSLFSQFGTVDTEAKAVFTNLEYGLNERLTAILGLRYSDETRSREGTFTAPSPFANTLIPSTGKKSWDDFTPKLTLDYVLNESSHIYGSIGQGFKSGVFIAGSANPAVEPETVTSFEVGVKSRMNEGRVFANAAVFYNDYDDLQLNRIVGTAVVLENATDARIYGFELELDAYLSDSTFANLEVAYTKSEFREYVIQDPARPQLGPLSLTGNVLPQAPEWTLHAAIEKRFNIESGNEISARLDWSWRDEVFFDPFNQPNNYQGAYSIFGAQVGFTPSSKENFNVKAWVRNWTDETVFTSGAVSSDFLGYPQLTALNNPRVYGVGFEFRR